MFEALDDAQAAAPELEMGTDADATAATSPEEVKTESANEGEQVAGHAS
jgi:hypothetical protein